MDDNKFVGLIVALFIALLLFFYQQLSLITLLFVAMFYGTAVRKKSFMPAYFGIGLFLVFGLFFPDFTVLGMLLLGAYLIGSFQVSKKDADE